MSNDIFDFLFNENGILLTYKACPTHFLNASSIKFNYIEMRLVKATLLFY
jgi:hypothetical protein